MVTPGDIQNRTRPQADEGCSDCGGRGRRSDDFPCPSCDAGLPYYADLPRDPESLRLARELAVLMAANAGT